MPTHDSYDDLFRDPPAGGAPKLTLRVTPERSLIRPHGSRRHVVFSVSAQVVEPKPRRALTLALVIDRSGSMAGAPLAMAKFVAMRVINSLTPQDQVAVVAFDDKMTTIQALAHARSDVKMRIAGALAVIEAGESTALHEGWLTGCNLIAGESVDYKRIAHALLLTDGQANVGLMEPMEIARQVADLRARCNIGTDTYGLGEDYNQDLLGPMAMGGEGQFTHLRTPADLEGAFLGVVENLRSSVASCVRLELSASAPVNARVVSAFWQRDEHESEARWSLGLGELAGGEERPVVVGFTFPGLDDAPQQTVRARLVWKDERGENHATAWQETIFTYASDDACSEEPRNADAMRIIGLATADRIKEQASVMSDAGQYADAGNLMDVFIDSLKSMAAYDPEIAAEVEEMLKMSADIKGVKFNKMASKEAYFQAQRRSRSQKDFRGGSEQ